MTTTSGSRLIPLSLAAALSAAPAGADHRQDVLLGAHAGVAYQTLHTDQVSSRERTTFSPAFFAAYGTAPRTVVGLELDGWPIGAWSDSLSDEELSTVMAFVRLRPLRHSGLYLHLGGGYASYTDSQNSNRDGDGAAWAAGGGYEIRIGDEFSVLPQLIYSGGRFSDGTGPSAETGRRYDAVELSIGLEAKLVPEH